MRHIDVYLDFVSPYAYLAFERLPHALEGLSHTVTYRPVLLGGLLKHHGNQAPAEVPAKRAWVYRQTQWLARHHGIAFDPPAVHPFPPLPLLRLALACAGDGTANRFVAGTVLRHVWTGGDDPNDAQRLAGLAAKLAPRLDPAGAEVKALLRANTDAAAARGVFGVPSFVVEGEAPIWGLDALPMLRDALK
ncbi:2-hydroxychromene-2-carboxylate isomerase [Xylophilus sp.]|uniref:2-hydroxychromene-2-carboxylate isomerase n=1 Tax=Xylophilus sp. TaxID=2653893 RepID=UPI0013B86F53|nr:2-hydroxychromene-2-carboxylate isomerase [Xylophilus sp.]KAF1043577.1 MAG: 2-hydroxychromene-2-carboxylate isomerase [Xylophilus sp.]